ncbi:hypothetical protein CIHG_08068 [Coccidioides immitis H538.4]|uniref:Uncharacterized protein n=1 Tax=Coccidioides immitis H538.4 TaxID=396776 RepID=A0A0J8URL2_COCIT|nr:hypothetical protein CIHG_08068 [Coccidioides immitis H538.4]
MAKTKCSDDSNGLEARNSMRSAAAVVRTMYLHFKLSKRTRLANQPRTL